MKQVSLYQGDNMISLKKLEDNSVDSVVTDGPYGLGKEQDMNIVLKDWIEKGYSEVKGKGFMGNEWDAYVPQPLFWKEIYRVLKPGGHILSFFGTRTYDIGTMAIRLAGFEIRDQVMWLYGSGFPKSHNIGKAVDKIEGNEREVIMKNPYADGAIRKATGNVGGDDNVEFLGSYELENGLRKDTKGQSKYEGWGTALKPANEPICVARKPLSEKTIAENVIKWGTGGINIDGCRISTTDTYNYKNGPQGNSFSVGKEPDGKRTEPVEMNSEGRFPANIILDETAAELLDEQSGESKSSKSKVNNKGSIWNSGNEEDCIRGHNDSGGASRYFYVAKVSKKERNLGLDDNMKSIHPTMKPINLMTYLCRLVTPEGGIVLDPFMGSGSTGIAARLENLRFIGMEMDEDYFKIATARIEAYEEYRKLIKK